MHLQAGTYLQGGRYCIEKVLGQGGFGITYSGIQTNLEAKVAIKEFFMKDLCNRDSDTSQVSVGSVGSREIVERFRQKFIKEARNIFRLKHRHIISVIDVFEENGTAYYVMEYVSGGSLADKVRDGALPESVAVRYIRQVAAALDFVHSRRMMHLDVKPANTLLDENDNAVLIDFGLAKQYDTEGQQTSCNPVGISHGYAPLEQYKRDGVSTFSPATDIYSLGAMLFKLVTGITPPEASDVNDEGLPALPSGISPTVRAAIETAMEPKRKDRPQSIAEFLKLLENGGESKDERAESKDETLLSSSSTPGGEVSRSDGGESELSKVKTENGKLKTASFDDEEIQVDINPPRPSGTPPFEKVGELSKADSDDDETLLNSSSTPGGEVSRSGGGESDQPTVNTENAKNYTVSSDDEETHVGMNTPRPSATPPFEKVGEFLKVDSDDETLLNSSSTPRGEVPRSGGEESELKTENGKSKLPLIIIILLLSIILGAGGYLLFSGGSDGNSSNNDSSHAAEKQALLEREAQAEERERIAAEQAAAEEQARLEREAEEKRAREEAERIAREKQQGISTQQKVDLGLSVCWAGWNVGASSPEEYGNYYAWGETTTKTSYTYGNCSTDGKSIGCIAGNSTYDVARAQWGGSWRLPTKEEFKELDDRCTWTWTTYKGVNGYKVTGPNGNSIFLPAAGRFAASLQDRGTDGDYWSATPYESDSDRAYGLCFGSGGYITFENYRDIGNCVRPVSE